MFSYRELDIKEYLRSVSMSPAPVKAAASCYPRDVVEEYDDAGRLSLVYTAISQEDFLPTAFHVFKNSLNISRPRKYMPKKPLVGGGSTRTEIKVLSQKSKTRLRFNCLNARLPLISQFCLSYPKEFPNDGRLVQAHFNSFMTTLRGYLKRQGIDFVYLWVKEFQRRGAPHYHLFLSLPVSDSLHQYMAFLWNRIAGKSQSPHLMVHLNKQNFITWDMGNGQYLTKYLEKNYQKMTPDDFKNVGRFWGACRGIVKVDHDIPVDDLKQLLSDSEIKNIVRWLGRWHENKLKRIYIKMKSDGVPTKKIKSKVRQVYQSSHIFHSAALFRQIITYYFNLPDELEYVPF